MAKTYNDIYMDARNRFRQAGISEYSLEARILLAHIADKSISDFYKDIRLYTSRQYEEEAEKIINRRINGEPVAHITGCWEFYGLPIIVSKDALIPRMDTEVVVESALELLKGKKAVRVLDICCGSGCIGIAIGANLPEVRLVLADKSEAALKVAKQNVLLNRLSSRISCIQCDALQAPKRLLGVFDMIISNPPYIRTDEIENLDISVRNYEPIIALDGGEDGLMFYRSICAEWKKLLNEDGYLIFECGINQSADVIEIGKQAGFKHIRSVKDTLDIERAIILQNTGILDMN